MTPPASDYAAEIDAWRRKRLERLVSEDGWLSLTGLFWLEPGDNPVGSDPASAVVLPAGRAPARVGVVRLRGGSLSFEPEPGVPVTANRAPIAGVTLLQTDAAEAPTALAVGTIGFYVLERGGRFAVRVRDRENPARRRLGPIETFPVDPAWRLDARFAPYDPARTIPVTSILGTVEQERSPGAVVFSVAGRELSLDPIFERGETDYWIILGDRTNGVDTYGGGRFVYVPPPVEGHTVLDFNKAYNPPCVFTPYSTCPLPPPQNRLPIRVEAGEKAYRA